MLYKIFMSSGVTFPISSEVLLIGHGIFGGVCVTHQYVSKWLVVKKLKWEGGGGGIATQQDCKKS
jgi:hypothetical protein